MNMRRTAGRTVVGLLLLLSAGCADHLPPNLSVEAKVAVSARQVITMTDGVLTALDDTTELVLVGETDPIVRKRVMDATVAAARVARSIGLYGQELSGALQTWHELRLAGRPAVTASERVRQILRAIQKLLPDVLNAIDNQTIRSAVNMAVKFAIDAVLNVNDLVNAGQPALVPATP